MCSVPCQSMPELCRLELFLEAVRVLHQLINLATSQTVWGHCLLPSLDNLTAPKWKNNAEKIVNEGFSWLPCSCSLLVSTGLLP